MIRPHPDREVSPTPAEPAGNEPFADPPGSRPGSAAPVGHGMGMSWAGDIAIEEILAAADRLRRTRAGYDLPAWGEPERPAKSASARLRSPSGPDPSAQEPSGGDPLPGDMPTGDRVAGDPLAGDPGIPAGLTRPPLADDPGDPQAEDAQAEDPQGEDPQAGDEAWDYDAGAGEPMTSPEIAGHVRMRPGPGLAAWLGQAQPGHLDEAGLVNSITGWRKLTSWAQAQELAAVAELGRRRGVMDDAELERDPARELAAEFAPNEVALALTLTQYAAEWWTNLAVSMSRRLPATWSALSEGTIDLGRAKLIDLWTTSLDDDLAQAVERKVLVRAGRQTTGQLRASLQRAVISVDPAAAERRRKQAEKNARVELAGEESGTAALSGHFLPAAQASAAWARINGLAEAMKGNGAGGGIDLLRAQVFVGLLLGTLPQPPGQAEPGDSDPPGASPDGGTAPGDSDIPPGNGGIPPRGGRIPPEDNGRIPPEDKGNATTRGDDGEIPVSRHQGEAAPSEGTGAGSGGGDGPGEGLLPGSLDGDDSTGRHHGTPEEEPWRWPWPPIPAPDDLAWPGAGGSPAKIRRPELTVPWRTLAGWWDEPGQLTRMGAITAEVARELARAAVADPGCVWRVVVTDARGQVMTVTRMRWPGRARRKSGYPPWPATDPPGAETPPHGPAGPARLAEPGHGPSSPSAPERGALRPGVLGRITVTVPVTLLDEPPPATLAGLNAIRGSGTSAGLVAVLRAVLAAGAAAVRGVGRPDPDSNDGGHVDGGRGAPCTHANAAPGYRIPDRMRDLIEVRDQDCGFPICRRPASRCDLDHTVPYDQGGLTCPCNLSGGCRHDHRMKGSTAWRLRQPVPGTLIWTAPSGLSWSVTPAPYAA